MRLFYYLVIFPISNLPSWMLYRLSDVLYVVLYRVVGYRKKVVRMNIRKSFPDQSSKKHREIERIFYAHFCDLVVESVKGFTISRAEVQKRFTHRNTEVFDKFFERGQHVTLVGGHYGNWELFAVSVGMHIPHQPVALYTPLANKFMNAKILESRSKYGLHMANYKDVKEQVKITGQKPMMVIFGSDQCPRFSQQPYWMEFLHQETGVQFGAEKFSRDYNTPVIYGVIHRKKRGHYEMEYRLVCERPAELPLGQISYLHTKELERDIRNEPAFWLWTHKRWKRTRADFEARARQKEIKQ
ncbi:MAG: lysophospholipid acyltransferase family protein [Cyclobacteriaceae bacterium]|nr:lysophospholipid acyltransferase family protein [Cyclobacteriaceae bacterium]